MNRNSKFSILISVLIAIIFICYNYIKRRSVSGGPAEKTISMENWVNNSIHGFHFESPEVLKKEDTKLLNKNPEIKEVEVYLLKKPQLIVMFMFMNTSFEAYDLRKGLFETIENSLGVIGGHSLKIDFTSPEMNQKKLFGAGEAELDGQKILVNGSMYWDAHGQIRTLVSFINKSDDGKKVNLRIINSGQLIF